MDVQNNHKTHLAKYLTAPALPVVALVLGIGGWLWFADSAWYRHGMLMLLLLVTTSTWLLQRQSHHQNQQLNSAAQRQAEAASLPRDTGAERTLSELMPLWLSHLGEVHEQTADAIQSLTQRFGNLIGQISSAISNSQELTSGDRKSGGRDIVGVFADSRGTLQRIVNRLEEANAQKAQTLSMIEELGGNVKQLEDMAVEVSRIADQTNLLALNASIEAARAGDAGRGFAVVATEVRQLSHQSGDTGKRIRELVDRVTRAMQETVHQAQVTSSQDQASVNSARQDIGNVLDKLQDLTQGMQSSSELLREASQDIRREVEDILVSLQFQDRVSQIMGSVTGNMQQCQESLQRVMSEGGELDQQSLVNGLRSSYTTAEQRRSDSGHTASASGGDDVTFF